jgi:hypothetical protein
MTFFLVGVIILENNTNFTYMMKMFCQRPERILQLIFSVNKYICCLKTKFSF